MSLIIFLTREIHAIREIRVVREIRVIRVIIFFITITLFTTCTPKPFFEDPSDPGLSRFTSRGYDAGSAYINGAAWLTGYSSFGGFDAAIEVDTNLVGKDSLYLSFIGEYPEPLLTPQPAWRNYSQLMLALPVKKNFTRNDFLGWNGKVFPADTTFVTLYLSNGFPPISPDHISGTGKIYFTRIYSINDPQLLLGISGLFEGKIGDSVTVSKGRFDFQLPEFAVSF